MAEAELAAPRVRLLGAVGFGAATEVGVAGTRATAVLAMLALHAGSLVTTEQLIDGVWGEHPPPSARNALQVHVSGLRKVLTHAGLSLGTKPAIIGTSAGYTLNVAPDSVDALVAEWLLKLARLGLLRGQTGEADRQATQALGMWFGPELGGVGDARFAATERPRLRQLRLSLTEIAVDSWLASGRHAEVIALAEEALAESPFHEGLWRRLMLALYRSGRSADALAAFDRAAAALRDELGLDPGPELSGMQAAILRRDHSLNELVAQTPVPTQGVTAEPTRPVGPPASERRPGVLPFETAKLVGRADEVLAIVAMLHTDGARLVTVLGPGGIGKTRVAVEVARVSEHGWSTAFVDLSSVDTVAAAMEEVVRSLGRSGVGDDAIAEVAAAVDSQDMLIVLDNVEQIEPALGRALINILAAAPTVRLLATSRVALNIPAENRYPLRPMRESDAAALFSARARNVIPGFSLDDPTQSLVRAVCRKLDNIPLAVELAAARLRIVPMTGLERHLEGNLLALRGSRDAPDRHRTLRAAIAGSVAVLGGDTAAMLEKLSVFRGGFTLDAASSVIALDDLATVEHLEQLIDSSLVVGPAAEDMLGESGAPRFALLEPIRQFLAESLAAGNEAASTRDRHAAHYLHRFSDGDATIELDPSGHAVATDLANIDLAVRALAASDGAAATRLLTAIYRRIAQLGRLPQLLDWAQAVLSGPALSPLDDALLRSVRGRISYSVSVGWPIGAADFVDAVHALIRLDVPSYTAIIGCTYCASHLVDCGQFDEATEIADHALRWGREVGEPVELNLGLTSAQYVARLKGDTDRALALGLEALDLMRRSRDRFGLASALSETVCTLVGIGRGGEAEVFAHEAEELVDDRDGPMIRSQIARAIGRARIGAGRYREAIGPLLELHRLEVLSGFLESDVGWSALAIESVEPAVAATVLGAAQRMQAETGDPDAMPPPAVGAGFEQRLQESHPDNVERGRRLGWIAIQTEVEAWAARTLDQCDESPQR
jgi:predicted ATPase/DNA-binding SARP family transcriptional activator